MCVEGKGVDKILQLVKEGKVQSLKNLVLFDELADEEREEIGQAGLKLYRYTDLIKSGKKNNHLKLKKPNVDTIYMFCYTSGTTGEPKAAMLANSCFVAN